MRKLRAVSFVKLSVIGLSVLALQLDVRVLNVQVLGDERHSSDGETGGHHELRWSFQPPETVEVPSVESAAQCDSPIDAFVAAKLEEQDLKLSPIADKLTLVRRAFLDLTGLLPSPEEQREFVGDDRPDSFERLTDRLLASPHYGERWARHWLDVVRYAESAGFKIDETRFEAYRYRDYVIAAYNSDKPYNTFALEQLAGDEIRPESPQVVVATGLNRLYPEESNASNFRLSRQHILDDITETTSLAFLGLTVGCAKCHDHKFDPIAQTDFFRLQACFAPMMPRNDVPAASEAELLEYQRKLRAWETETAAIRAEMDQMTGTLWPAAMEEVAQSIDSDTATAIRTVPAKRNSLQWTLAALVDRTVVKKMARLPKRLEGEAKARFEALEKKLAEFNSLKPAPISNLMSISDAPGDPPETFVLQTGDYRRPMDAVDTGFPEFLSDEPVLAPASPQIAKRSSGRRTALANWLGRSDHPLTSRVYVNRVWQHLFGVGIVPTPNDFGTMGEKATHPQLLDWLSVDFVKAGWSTKSVQRVLLTSHTYRQLSRVYTNLASHRRGLEVDSDNTYLWHARRRRMEGELIRDNILLISGELSRRVHGVSTRSKLPEALAKSSRYVWEADPVSADYGRRSIYMYAKRNLPLPILGAFDPPDVYRSTPVRGETVTATQTMTLLNNEFSLDQARCWAGALLEDGGSESREQRINRAFLQIYGRRADSDEIELAESFLTQQAGIVRPGPIPPELLPSPLPAKMSAAEATAWVDLCHSLYNSNEFLFVD